MTLATRQLIDALAAVFRFGGPIAVGALLLCAASYLAYRSDSYRGDASNAAVELKLGVEQLARAKRRPPPDLAFIGDSSCLTGVHAATIRAHLRLSAENFCTTARGGPPSYAHMLDEMIAAQTIPAAIILAFHPAQFRRQPSWDDRLAYMLEGRRDDRGALPKALDYARREWLGRAIYSPLPGIWGTYYGTEEEYFRHLRTNHGSLFDPARGIGNMRPEEQTYARTPEFDRSLTALARSIGTLPHKNVFLLLMPVPQREWGRSAEIAHRRSQEEITRALGLDLDKVIVADGYLPDTHFATPTHLSRNGRVSYSERLTPEIAKLNSHPANPGDRRDERPHR